MSQKCNYCTNKNNCQTCDKNWKDKFIPSDEVKQYFSRVYTGIGGLNGYSYSFKNTSEDLVNTHYIIIDGKHYCPYCGERMFPIQDSLTFMVRGYCCICQGARDEIEYEKKKKALEQKHEEELYSLRNEYRDKLVFCSDKLLDIKQKIEREDFQFFDEKHYHFSTLNDKPYSTIEQIVR